MYLLQTYIGTLKQRPSTLLLKEYVKMLYHQAKYWLKPGRKFDIAQMFRYD